MDKRINTHAAAMDARGLEPGMALEPRDVLMSQLETLYEPRVLEWIHRVKDATHDPD